MKLLLFVCLLCEVASTSSKLSTFWQLTDIHYDSNYSSPLVAPSLCQSSEGFRNSSTGSPNGGRFGDYNCDSPWSLVESAISAMKKIEPHPDFILWTGDSVPHAPDSAVNLRKVLRLMRNVTDLLRATFPNVPIYPMLGNHDTWPTDQMPGSLDVYYKELLATTGWDQMLDAKQQETFREGGFYMVQLSANFRIVVINSNLWYYHDKSSVNETDPANHFHWLELLMDNARFTKNKVLLVGHIPPGVFGRSADIVWFQRTFNWRFHNLMQRFHDIIVAAIFGHEHADGFHVVYDISDEPAIPLFMAPSVTPWLSTLPGVGSNNPGIRLYQYDKTSNTSRWITDYTQYFVNLTAANAAGRADWTVEYTATDAFHIDAVDALSLSDVISRFDTDSALFDAYYLHTSVGLDATKCRDACKRRLICAAAEVDLERYAGCAKSQAEYRPHPRTTSPFAPIDPHRGHHGRHIRSFTYFLLGALVTIVVVLFVVLAFCCCPRRHTVVLFSRAKYMRIENA